MQTFWNGGRYNALRHMMHWAGLYKTSKYQPLKDTGTEQRGEIAQQAFSAPQGDWVNGQWVLSAE